MSYIRVAWTIKINPMGLHCIPIGKELCSFSLDCHVNFLGSERKMSEQEKRRNMNVVIWATILDGAFVAPQSILWASFVMLMIAGFLAVTLAAAKKPAAAAAVGVKPATSCATKKETPKPWQQGVDLEVPAEAEAALGTKKETPKPWQQGVVHAWEGVDLDVPAFVRRKMVLKNAPTVREVSEFPEESSFAMTEEEALSIAFAIDKATSDDHQGWLAERANN